MARRMMVLTVIGLALLLSGCPTKETSESESAAEAADQDKPPVRPADKPAGPGLVRLSVTLAQSKSWRLRSGSEVTTWDEFSSKGLTGQIWRSFEFAGAGSP
jgi:hypothetical protein